MSDFDPTALPAIDPMAVAPLPDPMPEPAPVVFPSDSTPFAAPVDAPLSVAAPEVVAPEGGQLLTLPSGYKVALRGTRAVRARERKQLFVGVDFQSNDAMAVGLIVLANVEKLLITAWDVRDYDDATGEPVGDVLPIPSETTDDVLGGLSLEDANALDAASEAAQKVLLPNFAPSPDATSPTPPSAG